jgi:hypothetical protein
MLVRKQTLLAAATACAALAIPAAASAKDFCVGGPAGCSGTPVAAGGLKAALAAAQFNGTDDRFFLAAGTYADDAFSHQSPERVQIVGAGAGKTLLRGDIDDDWVLTLNGNPDSSVAGLTLEPMSGPRGALILQGGADAYGVTIDAKSAGSAFGWGAALFGGATFDHGRIDLGTATNSYAVGVVDTGTVSDSTLIAHSGNAAVVAVGSQATVRRSTLYAPVGAIADNGHLTISDSLIDLRGLGAGAGVAAMPGAGGVGKVSSLDVDRTTIVGSGGKLGVLAIADSAGKSATAHVRDTVISGFATPVGRAAMDATSSAKLTTDRSVYPSPATPVDEGPGSLVQTRHMAVSPQFVGNGDFHLAAGSPLIDAGTPGAVPAGATDRDGRPRASDGNGDCAHVSDIGAFEYRGTKAKAVARAAAASVGAGKPAAFSASGSCIPGPGAPTIRWRFDDGALAAGATAAHAFTTPGRHTATATVSDSHGHTAQATAAVQITAAAVPPRITRLRVTPARVRIGARPLGTIRFRLSTPATVTLRITKPGTRHKRTITITAHKGRNHTRLTRKLARTPGRYRLTATATDTNGLHSPPATTRFTAIKHH